LIVASHFTQKLPSSLFATILRGKPWISCYGNKKYFFIYLFYRVKVINNLLTIDIDKIQIIKESR
jgi:hypothetical protein